MLTAPASRDPEGAPHSTMPGTPALSCTRPEDKPRPLAVEQVPQPGAHQEGA